MGEERGAVGREFVNEAAWRQRTWVSFVNRTLKKIDKKAAMFIFVFSLKGGLFFFLHHNIYWLP